MSLEESWSMGTAAALRHAFDRSFAEAPAAQGTTFKDFLAIRIGGDPYALLLSEIAGLYADRKVVPIPSPVPALLGIASFRGTMAPVYDLRALLGYAPGAAPRWLILFRAPDLVGLAFDLFEAHFRVPAEDVASPDGGERASQHTPGIVLAPDSVRPLLHITSVLETIMRRVPPEGPSKEH